MIAGIAQTFGFKSFESTETVVGGEFEGGGSAVIGFSKSRNRLVVTVSMVAGPRGTLTKIEAGAIRTAWAHGADTIEIRASMVNRSMGRLLRRNGFRQDERVGREMEVWLKVIRIQSNTR